MDVYEAGRDDKPGRIQRLGRGRCGEIADGADAVAGYANVGLLPRLTGAVNDGSATDNEIEVHRYISFGESC